MNVKRIVVENVPDDCRICNFCNDDNGIEWCSVVYGKKLLKEYGRPSWCPLEVEEVCEYIRAKRESKLLEITQYIYETSCDEEFDDDSIHADFKHCPSCGKRIKYVESEE